MQNKKSLLQRLLVLYITFFIVVLAGLALGFLPTFSRGYSEGAAMGNNIVENLYSGTPRKIYMLYDIHVNGMPDLEIPASEEITSIKAKPQTLSMVVEQNAPEASVFSLAFSSLGGSPWIYAIAMLNLLAFIAIVVLMFLIIHSLRRSIREERTLDKRNVWMLRVIGLLTIFTELLQNAASWGMAQRAARLLAGSPYTVDTEFHLSYSPIIMGILILFAAEVFAIGQNLSEEQKLTI